MSAMPRYRRWQLWALEKNLLNMEHLISTITDPAVFDKRDGGDGWTISEVLGHLCDVDSYFLERARALAANGVIFRPHRARVRTRWSLKPAMPNKTRRQLASKSGCKLSADPYHDFLASLAGR